MSVKFRVLGGGGLGGGGSADFIFMGARIFLNKGVVCKRGSFQRGPYSMPKLLLHDPLVCTLKILFQGAVQGASREMDFQV